MPEAVSPAGAVYSPVALTVSADVVQVVAPGEANCCIAPSLTLAIVGEMVCGFGFTTVTIAEAIPPGPEAVTVTLAEADMVAGAVYSPLEVMVPAVAVQLVALGATNCSVAFRFTLAVVGEMVC